MKEKKTERRRSGRWIKLVALLALGIAAPLQQAQAQASATGQANASANANQGSATGQANASANANQAAVNAGANLGVGAPLPEPATWVGLSTLAIGAAWFARKRRRQAT